MTYTLGQTGGSLPTALAWKFPVSAQLVTAHIAWEKTEGRLLGP